jgi:hypothetical protein
MGQPLGAMGLRKTFQCSFLGKCHVLQCAQSPPGESIQFPAAFKASADQTPAPPSIPSHSIVARP